MSKTEVATTENKSVTTTAAATLPAHLQQDHRSDIAGLGNSEDARDRSMPFFAILQKGSPQVNEMEPQFIDGAKAGMLLNTATNRLYSGKEGVPIICCGQTRRYVEWKPNRQGWAGTHDFDIEKIKRLGAKKTIVKVEGKDRTVISLPNGNLLNETVYVFILLDGMPAVIGGASTALGPIRQWNDYRLSQKFPNSRDSMPSFAKVYNATTIYEKNDSGDWYNWKFNDAGFVVDADLYNDAKTFAIAIAKGEIKVGRPDDFDNDSNDNSRGTSDDGIDV